MRRRPAHPLRNSQLQEFRRRIVINGQAVYHPEQPMDRLNSKSRPRRNIEIVPHFCFPFGDVEFRIDNGLDWQDASREVVQRPSCFERQDPLFSI